MTSEIRRRNGAYDYVYNYDGGAHRRRKILTVGSLHDITTLYHYDYDDPATYGSNNNRLMRSDTTEFDFYGSSRTSTEETFVAAIETPADLAAAEGIDLLDRSTWPAELRARAS